MVKLTKRKGFNFFRSYFDVYNELESKDDKVAFMDALLERQFMGVKPTELKGMAKFAYISQTNSIDSQVKGYEDKTKTRLNPLELIRITPTAPPTYGGKVTPTVQVEEKEKEKVEVEDETINNIFLEHREKYKVYANQLFKDSIFVESICKEFLKVDNKEVCSLTLRKYLGLFLNSLDQSKKIHNNKKEFQQHFPHWMRKQPAILKVYPKEEKIRYS
jgi:hypothetical protein